MAIDHVLISVTSVEKRSARIWDFLAIILPFFKGISK